LGVKGAWARLAALAVLLLALFFLVQSFEAELVYFPGPPPEETPADHGLAYEDVRLRTSDGVVLAAWFMPGDPAGTAGAVVFSHGNAGNIAGRIPGAQAFLEAGFAVLLYDYRGYGASAGTPGEEGTYRDAEAAYDWLVAERGFAPARVVAYGESLGGAVAVELARRRRVGAVFVENTFTSLPDVGARLYPYLPVRLLATIRYASVEKVGELGVPLLVAHSPEDDVVPFELGRALFDAAREPKAFITTGGAHNHGGILQRAEWQRAVADFLHAALER
jgi:uncharacterized protein